MNGMVCHLSLTSATSYRTQCACNSGPPFCAVTASVVHTWQVGPDSSVVFTHFSVPLRLDDYFAGASRRHLRLTVMAGSAIKDKTVVVTGANRGLGLEASIHSSARRSLLAREHISTYLCLVCTA